jgi:predicted protein tyrosine phosphatase
MKLYVTNLAEAEDLWPEFDAVISLADCKDDVAPIKSSQHHVQIFYDYDQIGVHGSPKLFQVSQILDFVTKIPEDSNILVHCTYGASRSTAVAIAIAVQWGMSVREAVEYVYENRPDPKRWFSPNWLVLYWAEGILKIDNINEVVSAFRKIYGLSEVI